MRAVTLLMVLVLAACNTMPVVSDEKPLPPRVDCRERTGEPVPPWPLLWFLMGPSYAIDLLGIIEQDRTLRRLEHECADRLKAQGVIR